jgi:LysM repeat protein
MKKILILFLFICLSLGTFAQGELLVQNGDKGSYLLHTVAPKENFYSVGRLYAISPKDIAAFNGIDMAHGLSIGQVVQVPLTSTNYIQTSAAQGRPVYYVVGEKEGLYRVSLKNGNVLMADLRKWNTLKTDGIVKGQKLIVGYLGAAQAAPATAPQPTSTVINTPANPAAVPAVTPKKDSTAVHTDPPADKPKSDSSKRVEVVPTPAPAAAAPRTAATDGSGGFFKSQYDQQSKTGKDATVNAGIFKTASGWQDMKYYLLIDGVEPGTLVKITNSAGSKSIYAKVLGAMTGIRQNAGFDIRISNAAASVLGTADAEKFSVHIQY